MSSRAIHDNNIARTVGIGVVAFSDIELKEMNYPGFPDGSFIEQSVYNFATE